jgi:hypothetical protein
MKKHHARALAATLVLGSTLACGSSAPAPTAPTAPATPTAPAPPTGSSLNIAGAWSGTGSDPQGAERMTWMLAQAGSALSGTADLAPLDAADGSCASCHKFKTGTVTGSLSGNALAMTLTFPSGGDGVPTPMCTIVFTAAATGVDGGRINATYTGNDSCEGPFSGGTFVMTR